MGKYVFLNQFFIAQTQSWPNIWPQFLELRKTRSIVLSTLKLEPVGMVTGAPESTTSLLSAKPSSSTTCTLIHRIRPKVQMALLTNVSDEKMQEHYDNFFEDVFVEA